MLRLSCETLEEGSKWALNGVFGLLLISIDTEDCSCSQGYSPGSANHSSLLPTSLKNKNKNRDIASSYRGPSKGNDEANARLLKHVAVTCCGFRYFGLVHQSRGWTSTPTFQVS